MIGFGFRASALHPSVYVKSSSQVYLGAHVDDFLCVGPWGL